MILTLLCVFSIIPAHAGYTLTSFNASTTCPIQSVSTQWSSPATDSCNGNIYITGVPAPFSGTYTYTYTWSPAGSKPPATVYFLETAQAVGIGNGVSADDGLGDANTNPYGGAIYNFSKGTHYVGMAGTSTITIVVKPSIKASGSGTGAGASYSLSVSLVNKYGAILTSLGATYHKGAPVLDASGNQVFDLKGVAQYVPTPDTYDSSGTFQANTVIPSYGSEENITYMADAIGAWGSNSHWSLGIASQSSDPAFITALASALNSSMVPPTPNPSGTFSNPSGGAIQAGAYSWPYLNYDPFGTGLVSNAIFTSNSNTEQVTLNLTDGSDGSTSTENYNLNFHQPAENIIHIGSAYDVTGDSDKIGEADGIQPDESTASPFYPNAPVFNWKTGAIVGQGVLIGATVVCVAASVAIPPLGVAMITAGGFALSQVPGSPYSQCLNCTASEDQFKNSITEETTIRSGNTSAVWLPSIRRMASDPTDYSYRMASQDEYRAFRGLDGATTCNILVYWHHSNLDFSGDLFGAQGYTGSGYCGSDGWQNTPMGIYVWKIVKPS
jgi:hypothetical protein